MMRTTMLALATGAMLIGGMITSVSAATTASVNAYAFTFQSIDGAPLPLESFRGKVILVVNTASFCGFTPQYKGLQALWETYKDQGLVVLGVPSNDFGQQEPGGASEIKEFCETTYHIDFPLTAKTTVSGADAHPFYQWAGGVLGIIAKPRWNFHKYLISRDGQLIDWFSSLTDPTASGVESAIKAALAK